MTTDPTIDPTTTRTQDRTAAWYTCPDPDTCDRPHWLAAGYHAGILTAVTLHEPAPAVRAPAQRSHRRGTPIPVPAAALDACVPAPVSAPPAPRRA